MSLSTNVRLVGGDRDGRALLAFGENLEQQFCAAAIQLHVPQLVDQDQIDSAVAVDQLGQLLVVGGFDEFVD
jgi:hypothetical protein